MENEKVFTYIQSRFYRSPEVRPKPPVHIIPASACVLVCDSSWGVLSGSDSVWRRVSEVDLGLRLSRQLRSVEFRWYRAQVLLGLSYHCAIDMWSFGCILAELYTG